MKKLISCLLVLTVLFLVSCKNVSDEESTVSVTEETTQEITTEVITTVESLTVLEEDAAESIIVYFSHNDPVAAAAEYISESTSGKLLKIETVGEYPDNEDELVKKAAQQHRDNVRPALKNAPQSMSEYDIVFLCFPAWDNTMPMALFTLIEDYDMREKAVIPVVFGSSDDLDNAVRDIHSIVPSMMIAGGYSFTSDFSTEQPQIENWLKTVLYG